MGTRGSCVLRVVSVCTSIHKYFRSDDYCGHLTTQEVTNSKLMNIMRMNYQSSI